MLGLNFKLRGLALGFPLRFQRRLFCSLQIISILRKGVKRFPKCCHSLGYVRQMGEAWNEFVLLTLLYAAFSAMARDCVSSNSIFRLLSTFSHCVQKAFILLSSFSAAPYQPHTECLT